MMKPDQTLDLDEFMQGLIKRNPGEIEFHQAVEEVAASVIPFINEHPQYVENRILERMTEPDRTIIFRVCWEDDEGNVRTNRGYRIQFNNAIGPYKCKFHKDKRPWSIKAGLAFPCATQNELELPDAKLLIKNGCRAVAEGANMPTTKDAIDAFHKAKIIFSPGKASNAGGVSVSGLEMTQNSIRLSWQREELEERLKTIMHDIHQQCVNYGTEKDHVDYIKGANIAGFVKVAEAMVAYGVI